METLTATIEDAYGTIIEVRTHAPRSDDEVGFCHLSLSDKKEDVDACAELDLHHVRALRDLLTAALGE